MIPDGPREDMEPPSKITTEDETDERTITVIKSTDEPKVNGESEQKMVESVIIQELRENMKDKSSVSAPHHGKHGDDDPSYSSEDEEKLVINMTTDRKLDEPYSLDLSKRDKSSKRKCEEEENKRKKIKVSNEIIDNHYSEMQIDGGLFQLRKELSATQELIYQKEEEWDALLRQQKKQEFEMCRLLRRKKILQQKFSGPDSAECSGEENDMRSPQCYREENLLSALKLHSHKNNSQRLGTRSPTSEPSISVIDIRTNNSKFLTDRAQVSISPESQSRFSKQLSAMKPILPKDFSSSSVSIVNTPSSSPQPYHPQTGFGPQGPTVSVDQIIAAHRKDHPTLPPIRGAKRGAWRHRYDGDKYVSSRDSDRPSGVSISPGDAERNQYSKSYGGPSNMPIKDPTVSFKDVLIQFAQMTQNEKSSCPQVSIIPVTSDQSSLKKTEPSPDSTSVAQISSGNSLEGSSALAKLLLESRVSGQSGVGCRPTSADTSVTMSPQYLTLTTLLGGGSSTPKDKGSPSHQLELRSKKDDMPLQKCQGCHQHKAQFVCAGCGNQWYCSRDCQVNSWEDHSENCTN